MRFRTLLLLLICVVLPSGTRAQSVETGFLNRTITVRGVERHYQVYVPRGYTNKTKWPVILALHGGGERGGDGLKQTEVGLGRAIRLHEERFQAIVVFPQSPADSSAGWQGENSTLALAALDRTVKEFSIDESRVYLTGLSMGGNGSWYLAARDANRFAAAVIICGFVNGRKNSAGLVYPAVLSESGPDVFTAVATRAKDLPIWIFHGDADAVVPVAESRGMYAALKSVGGNVQYTEYPGVNHPSWDRAYDTPELWSWLFSQRRR